MRYLPQCFFGMFFARPFSVCGSTSGFTAIPAVDCCRRRSVVGHRTRFGGRVVRAIFVTPVVTATGMRRSRGLSFRKEASSRLSLLCAFCPNDQHRGSYGPVNVASSFTQSCLSSRLTVLLQLVPQAGTIISSSSLCLGAARHRRRGSHYISSELGEEGLSKEKGSWSVS